MTLHSLIFRTALCIFTVMLFQQCSIIAPRYHDNNKDVFECFFIGEKSLYLTTRYGVYKNSIFTQLTLHENSIDSFNISITVLDSNGVKILSENRVNRPEDITMPYGQPSKWKLAWVLEWKENYEGKVDILYRENVRGLQFTRSIFVY